MSEEPEKALDEIAEGQRKLGDGLEADVKRDEEKAKGGGLGSKRPWWKVWWGSESSAAGLQHADDASGEDAYETEEEIEREVGPAGETRIKTDGI